MEKQTRYNLFNLIHKGLRHLLYDVALNLQRTDFGSQDSSEKILKQIEMLLDYFDGHAEVEDAFILPAIQRYHPDLASDFENQHVEDHRLGQLLLQRIAAVRNQSDGEKRIASGAMLLHVFQEFIAFNLYHMNREESELNEVLWEHFTDLELHAITQQIIQQIAPDKLMALNRWMMRSIHVTDAIGWLSGIQKGAPAGVFNLYLQLAAEELNPDAYLTVRNSLAMASKIQPSS